MYQGHRKSSPMSSKLLELNGIFAVNKPSGLSSAKVISMVKQGILANAPGKEQRWLARKMKVGHGGTLDPMASGVLIVGIGRGCKELSVFLSGNKTYCATGRFGKAFDTLDCTGVVVKEAPIPETLNREAYQSLLDTRFTGEILQRPPAFSAVHVNGKRAYEIARDRQKQLSKATECAEIDDATLAPELELPERPVKIERVQLTRWDPPEFDIEIECGGGTYIRSLISDSAQEMGTLAAMFSLTRTRQGQFALQDCLAVDECWDLDRLRAAMRSNAPVTAEADVNVADVESATNVE